MEKEKLNEYFSTTPKMLDRLFYRCQNLWEILPELGSFLKINTEKAQMNGLKVGEVYIDHDVIIGRGSIIEHGAMIKGPAIIGDNCQIRNGAYIRGNAFIESNTVIGHCVEIKNSIIMEGAHLGHFNYVGDSIIGNNVNLGAGSILANLRFDRNLIKIGEISTELKKFGAILGDNSMLACNTVLNPGTIFKKEVKYSGNSLKSGIYSSEDIKKNIKKSK